MQRFKRYFPVFMIALMVQIIAPIGVNWAFATAVSDPLAAAEICLGHSESSDGNQGDQQRGHDASCVLCCGFSANAAPGHTPEPSGIVTLYRSVSVVVWHQSIPRLAEARIGSNAKARAPPILS